MKKCPVCGVMMGDNVARCFMCKYDFQKAAREGEDVAKKEATEHIKKVDQETSSRVNDKKAEEEKILTDAKNRNRLVIESLQQQLDEEKLRLEEEYVEIRKNALEEKTKLEQEIQDSRSKAEEEKQRLEEAIEENKKAAMAEGDKLLKEAKELADSMLKDANEQTEKLGLQVRTELDEAMTLKDQLLEEAKQLKEETDTTAQKLETTQAEYTRIQALADEASKNAEQELADLKAKAIQELADSRKQAEIDEDARIAAAEAARKKALEEVENVVKEIEKTRRQGEEELTLYINEAKAAIAAAEEAKAAGTLAEEEALAATAIIQAEKEQAEAEMRKIEEDVKKAMEELKAAQDRRDNLEDETSAVLLMTEEARKKAEVEAKESLALLEKTRDESTAEITRIVEECRLTRESAEAEAALLAKEIEGARATIDEADVRLHSAEAEAEKIIIEAEKRAVLLKEEAISESEKGRMAKKIEENKKLAEEALAAKEEAEKKVEELANQMASSLKAIQDMEKKVEKLRSSSATGSFKPVSVPMEYEVEAIAHKPTGEVDSEEIAVILSRRGAEGWKLHSMVNDEGSRNQSTIAGSEQFSLSSGITFKEDRVIMIFERVSPTKQKVADEEIASSQE